MALPTITVITPDNLKTIFQSLFTSYPAKLINKLFVKTEELNSSVVLTADTTTVNIGITGYNKTNHVLHVYKTKIINGDAAGSPFTISIGEVLVDPSEYTISTDSTSITFNSTVAATTTNPVTVKFSVIKSTLQTS